MLKAPLTCVAVNSYVNKEIVTFGTSEGATSPFSRPGTESPLQLTLMNPDEFGKFRPGKDYTLTIAPNGATAADPGYRVTMD